MPKYVLLNFSSEEEFIAHAIDDFHAHAEEAMRESGRFNLGLSGGKSPAKFYEALGRLDMDFSRVHIYMIDERYVAKADPQSNFGLIQRNLLSQIKIPNANIHPILTELTDPHEAARLYEIDLKDIKLDLVYLGIGKDGHTASLFPRLLIPANKKISAFFIPKLNRYRISMLPDLINKSRNIRFIVSGQEKQKILDYILQDPEAKFLYPCQLIRPCEILAYGL